MNSMYVETTCTTPLDHGKSLFATVVLGGHSFKYTLYFGTQIKAKIGGQWTIHSGPSFVRLRYWFSLYYTSTCMSY